MESVFATSDSTAFRVDYVEPDRPESVRHVVATDEVAWYDGVEGSYVGCEDAAGRPKTLAPVRMAAERPGPWVYRECSCPVGGEASLCSFVDGAQSRGWHVASIQVDDLRDESVAGAGGQRPLVVPPLAVGIPNSGGPKEET